MLFVGHSFARTQSMSPIVSRFVIIGVALVLSSADALNGGAGGGWFVPSDVQSMDSAAFHTLLAPLFRATTLSYTATFGTYYNPFEANETVDGFTKSSLESNPPLGGMRSLVFVENAPGVRIIVVYRGTDLNSTTPGGQSDLCADQILWDNISDPSLMYPFCASIPPAQLDYYSQAKQFLRSVMLKYAAPYQIMLTGHSLGAGLSNMMVLSTIDPDCFPPDDAVRLVGSVVMSSPSFILPTMQRVRVANYSTSAGLQLGLSMRITTIADSFDPIYMEANRNPIGLLGGLCTYTILPEPFACSICQLDPTDSPSNIACELCFAQRHIYSHYLHTFENSTLMPSCAASPRDPCQTPSNAQACTGHGSACNV